MDVLLTEFVFSILQIQCIVFYFTKSCDFIAINDGTDNVYNETGQIVPTNIQSSSSEMTIHFTSGDNGESNTTEQKGFEIVIEYILPGNAGILVR